MWPLAYRVRRVQRETGDTFTLELEPADGEEIGPFAPGQFNMLYAFGAGEVPISISGDPATTDRLQHTTRVVGAVTQALGRLRPGDGLGVRGPFGSGWPVEEAQGHDVVVVAGGIGLAPLRPALYQLLARREKYGRIVLLYGARTPGDILYRRQLEKWRGHFDLEVHVAVDRATPGWRGNVGVVTALIPRAPFDPFSALALVCGPEVMMRFAVQALLEGGVAARNIFASMERNMKCGIGLCGHCQFGPHFICKDGPVFRGDLIAGLLDKKEI
jgi:NAD(P)H-flavin reductase